MSSYHDIDVAFNGKRIRLFDAIYGLELTCTRVSGWQLWYTGDGREKAELLASEYGEIKLRIYVAGTMILGDPAQDTEIIMPASKTEVELLHGVLSDLIEQIESVDGTSQIDTNKAKRALAGCDLPLVLQQRNRALDINETDYIKVTNKAKVGAAIKILSDVLPGDDYGITEIEYLQFMELICQAEERLFASFKISDAKV